MQWIDKRDKIIEKLGSGFLIALVGKRGPGKTQIAQQAVLMATGHHGREARYVRAMTFFLNLRATYSDETDSEARVIADYRKPHLLVIDEMQERGDTPWEDRMLNHLIDLRYGDMRDTLIIANLQPADLKAKLGESIVDRMRETGGIIECTWPSFRGKDKP
jgi:DNA replication protein DnaC